MIRQAGILILVISTVVATSNATEPDPQYIFFNIAPGHAWKQSDPATFTRDVFDDVRNTLQVPENPDLRIGVSFVFSVLQTHPDVLVQSLQALLQASEESGVPVLVNLDGQNWWEHRPDLWNWWEPSKPGHDPDNVYNVEWTDWDPSSAVKVGWRNWGSQIRVAPAQNIASPQVIGETLSAMHPLAAVVAEWYRELPEDRKYLFGGLKVGWEASIGVNAFYYPDGNCLVDDFPDTTVHDPTYGRDHSKGLFGGLTPLGYAAVKTAGIKSSGEITRDDLATVVHRYLATLAEAVHDAGIPKEKLFTHQGGTYTPWDEHLSFWPAVNEWSTPGWSFYGVDPASAGDLSDVLDQTDGRWAAVEWWWGAPDAEGWREHFERTLRFRDCRFICVYNWNQGGFQSEVEGGQAVRDLVRTWPESLVSPRTN